MALAAYPVIGQCNFHGRVNGLGTRATKEDSIQVTRGELGDFFGELALLYNCPRAASVVATEDASVWHLDRGTFNHIVRESAMRKHEGYEGYTPPAGGA